MLWVRVRGEAAHIYFVASINLIITSVLIKSNGDV
jgi:hypothetical protein